MKVVINNAVGGFDIEDKYLELLPKEIADAINYGRGDEIRSHPALVNLVEGLHREGIATDLVVVEIPDGVEYYIDECYDGIEFVAEKHRTWWGPNNKKG